MARRVCYVCVCLRLHGCRPVGALLAPLRRVNTYMSESLMPGLPRSRRPGGWRDPRTTTEGEAVRHKFTLLKVRLREWSGENKPQQTQRTKKTATQPKQC